MTILRAIGSGTKSAGGTHFRGFQHRPPKRKGGSTKQTGKGTKQAGTLGSGPRRAGDGTRQTGSIINPNKKFVAGRKFANGRADLDKLNRLSKAEKLRLSKAAAKRIKKRYGGRRTAISGLNFNDSIRKFNFSNPFIRNIRGGRSVPFFDIPGVARKGSGFLA